MVTVEIIPFGYGHGNLTAAAVSLVKNAHVVIDVAGWSLSHDHSVL